MQITKNKVATFDFMVTDEKGQVLDSSTDAGAFPYIHGTGYLVPGLEAAMEGKKTGDRFQVTVTPEQAYGERDERLVMDVPREKFQGMDDIELGIQIQVGTPEGTSIMQVVNITDESVTLDGNHPLAGMNLNFDVSIVDVRDATPEELEHGHPAGPDGSFGSCGCGDQMEGGCGDQTQGDGGGCGCGCSGC